MNRNIPKTIGGSVLGMTNTYIKFQVIGFNGSPETVRKRKAAAADAAVPGAKT